MAAGTIRAYQQASVLYNVPINLIGVAISTAAFPKMSERLSQGRPDLFKKELQSVLRIIIWLALPVTAISFFGRGYLISFIKNGGDTLMAGIFGVLALAILFRSIFHISSRSFYAQQDTKTPLYISFFAIGFNVALSIWFTMSLGMGAYGLAWATVIAAFTEVMILFVVMSRRIPELFDAKFIHAVARMLMATGIMSFVTYFSFSYLPLGANDLSFLSSFPKFALVASISLIFYVAVCWIFHLREVQPIVKRTQKIFFGGFDQ
jgi:putative peptidoglycan lipid II flippase